MSDRKKCEEPECGHDMPVSMQHCPHCGRPRRFPNVDVARLPRELEALQRRYEAAKADAVRRGAGAKLQMFEAYVAEAKPVLVCAFAEIRRLARADSELAATFYAKGSTSLLKGSHVLHGEKWDAIRPAAETAMFGDENKKEIHFAALSPDEEGLSNYGECSLTLRVSLIAHRTSVFEENMLVFFKTKCDNYWRTERLPVGYRSDWPNRAKLAVAKIAPRIGATTPEDDFAGLLLSRGTTVADDQFIELHVFGMMTIRTLEKVVLNKSPRCGRAVLRATRSDVERWNGQWVDRSSTR